MPWALPYQPSAALGILSATVKRDIPRTQVDCLFSYLDLFDKIGDWYEYLAPEYPLCECFYAVYLYPEKRELLTEYFVSLAEQGAFPVDAFEGQSPVQVCNWLIKTIQRQIAVLTDVVTDQNFDLIGFSSTMHQTFSSLAAAKAIRDQNPAIHIVLGGMAGAEKTSVIKEYRFLDYIISGYGEKRFIKLLLSLEKGQAIFAPEDGILTRQNVDIFPKKDEEVENIDLSALPLPDYDQFFEIANERSLFCSIPIEGSRGCWWDRVKKTKNPLHACHFCKQHETCYVDKPIAQIQKELKALTERHKKTTVVFTDRVMRKDNLLELGSAIKDLGKTLNLFMEFRASITPRECVRLWEAGCNMAQIGVEGLSTAYLKRLGKGTTAIQNLQTMKICYELGIDYLMHGSNLIMNFPQTPTIEVEEIAQNITQYATVYPPLLLVDFKLMLNSSVHQLPEEFGVSRFRNSENFATAVPEHVLRRLTLDLLDYDEGQSVDWSPVRKAHQQWEAMHDSAATDEGFAWRINKKLLYYADGGSFMEIVDRRDGFRLIELESLWRDTYVFCTGIQKLSKIYERFSGRASDHEIDEILDAFVSERLMFHEGEKYLSLACAPRPSDAARRILGTSDY